jgi:hypothetical protein
MNEEFRVFVYDDLCKNAKGFLAIRVWKFENEKDALKTAKDICERLNSEKDYMKNLLRYSVRVHRFHGYDLQYRSGQPLFDSMKEYP